MSLVSETKMSSDFSGLCVKLLFMVVKTSLFTRSGSVTEFLKSDMLLRKVTGR